MILRLILFVSIFLPIAVNPVDDPDFHVIVCNAIDDCDSDIETGADLIVSNLEHPTIASTEDGVYIPYSVTVSIPYSGVLTVEDVSGGLFDVYARDAEGDESNLPVQPVVTAGRSQVLTMTVLMP